MAKGWPRAPPRLPALLLVLMACLGLAPAAAQAVGHAATLGPAATAPDGGSPAGRRRLHLSAPQPDPPFTLDNLPLHLINLPPGLSISLYANASIHARFFAVGNRGRAKPTIVFVSTNQGKVRAQGSARLERVPARYLHVLAKRAR